MAWCCTFLNDCSIRSEETESFFGVLILTWCSSTTLWSNSAKGNKADYCDMMCQTWAAQSKDNYKKGTLNQLVLLRSNFVPKDQFPFYFFCQSNRKEHKIANAVFMGTWNFHCYFLFFLKSYQPCLFLPINRKVFHSIVHKEMGNQGSKAHSGTLWYYVQPLSRDLKQTKRSA